MTYIPCLMSVHVSCDFKMQEEFLVTQYCFLNIGSRNGNMTFTIAGGAGTLVKFQYNASDILRTLLQLAFADLILKFVNICQCKFLQFL